ncbi:MAG: hypothetical protein CVU56_08345 [Deltaproteobacteria bacterium HGW-Deltaproteobacteria-14]|nr:MAG: hypothetical protein CVU56_08345 [Deltaproteobacteria bacterium HGW-Deltaproteobacteria-14]
MSERTRTLTQSRRLGNSRRWGAGYRLGRRCEAAAAVVEPARAATAAGSAVIELWRHREHARQ